MMTMMMMMMCCEIEVSATGRLLVQRRPTACGLCSRMSSLHLDKEKTLDPYGLLRQGKIIRNLVKKKKSLFYKTKSVQVN